MQKLIEKIKKHNFMFLNYHYMGLFNSYTDEPIDCIDECCRTHDLGYDSIIKAKEEDMYKPELACATHPGLYPYIYFNFADEILVNQVKALDTTNFTLTEFEAVELIIAFFQFKKLVCVSDLKNY